MKLQPFILIPQGMAQSLGRWLVLTGNVRSANVTALEDSVVFRVPGKIFREVIEQHKTLKSSLEKSVSERLSHNQSLTTSAAKEVEVNDKNWLCCGRRGKTEESQG